jgi:hypothetical protein
MICRTIGRTIMFSQMGFPTINHHPRPGPVPMFVRYQRHRPRSGPWGFVRATGRDSRNGARSVPSAGIRPIGRNLRHQASWLFWPFILTLDFLRKVLILQYIDKSTKGGNLV